MTIFFFILLAGAIAGMFIDANSSKGHQEMMPIYQNKDKTFNMRKYLIWNFAFLAAYTIFFFVDAFDARAVVIGLLIVTIALRLWAGLIHNPKIKKAEANK